MSSVIKFLNKFINSPYWPAFLSGFIAPGIGQMVNRHITKGLFLLSTFFIAFIWFSNTLTNQLSLLLPGSPDQWQQDKAALKEALTSLISQHPGVFVTFHLLMITLWIYGIVDAYLSAKNPPVLPKQKEAPE